jgi:hypothetical protein
MLVAITIDAERGNQSPGRCRYADQEVQGRLWFKCGKFGEA